MNQELGLKGVFSEEKDPIIYHDSETILRKMTPYEYEVVKTLFFSPYGKTLKGIQRDIALKKIDVAEDKRKLAKILASQYSAYWPDEDRPHLVHYSQGGISKNSYLEILKKLPIESLLSVARTMGLSVPHHQTLEKEIANLLKNGILQGREVVDGETTNTFYFISSNLFVLLKKHQVFHD